MTRHHYRHHFAVVSLAGMLALVGVGGALMHPSNTVDLPSGLSVPVTSESTSIFCTGLTSTDVGASGSIDYRSAVDIARHVNVLISSDNGSAFTSFTIPALGNYVFDPAPYTKGSYFGVTAIVDGGGVVASEELNAPQPSSVPCQGAGVTDWFAAGFDTTVGSSAVVSILNPTATPAVYNLEVQTTAGFDAPASLHGVLLRPFQEAAVNLGADIVDTTNIGVSLHVLRGSVVVTGIQRLGSPSPSASLIAGTTTTQQHIVFPSVTTANGSSAVIRISNPSNATAEITLNVELANYSISPLTDSIAPYASGDVVVTPNPRVPAAGNAVVSMQSSVPIVASLLSGTKAGFWLTSSPVAATTQVLGPPNGQTLGDETVVNMSKHQILVNVSVLGRTTTAAVLRIARRSSASLAHALGLTGALQKTYLLQSTSQFVVTGPVVSKTGIFNVNGSDAG
jgi:hypothetical protein